MIIAGRRPWFFSHKGFPRKNSCLRCASIFITSGIRALEIDLLFPATGDCFPIEEIDLIGGGSDSRRLVDSQSDSVFPVLAQRRKAAQAIEAAAAGQRSRRKAEAEEYYCSARAPRKSIGVFSREVCPVQADFSQRRICYTHQACVPRRSTYFAMCTREVYQVSRFC